ncbi:propionyl-CoA carboxylase alpha chain [Jatrophihabitans sp. GAS493]|uniref:ATP-binding protein n=1 Tax=Jatrophihabitans sp. GAS493 TaxID=1907575 RepID=UPI000BB7C309|nr:biotin carboxylase N-terminal domain-containing protein [Jatrophihabitans sp. GAS493]SOD72614.1 propionyl-CoA carboxylase alpha chain [Jatrophihabitans sp. GAS493]
MITRVLVANRSEIAARVFRTCRTLGISTAAVYSDADADAGYLQQADVAARLPGSAPADTYLRGELIVAAARRMGADAIHPGYGFLSENAGFAAAVIDAGLTWIGPPVAAIESMGSKIEAKLLMAKAGVPTLSQLEPESITSADLPVLIKASAGGGGRGMRIVRDVAALPAELAAAQAEARSAFGDDTVFCEPYLATGHHIEVQILADSHGRVWTVGERECSIQRRHQKVIEEAPSPLVERTPGMRERLFEAARLAAEAIGYVGAGTVEFLADEEGRFYFLEMNTRLQVEHPVTECTTGLDLVAWQIRVANGEQLPAGPPAVSGHSIEARLYAEDPAAGWQPQSGSVQHFEVPDVAAHFEVPPRHGVRLDSGIGTGGVRRQVGIHYDPMLAKVISWAPNRIEAATMLAAALARTRLHGLVTNRDLLVNVLRHPAFLAGDTDTAFFATHGGASDATAGTLSTPLADQPTVELSALAAALADAADRRAAATTQPRLPSGWRNVVSQSQRSTFQHGDRQLSVEYRLDRTGLVCEQHPDARLLSLTPTEVVLEVEDVRRHFTVARYAEDQSIYVESAAGSVALQRVERFADPSTQLAAGSLLAPMPGSVIRVEAVVGAVVSAGEPLLTLEAMKMQHQISAPIDGVISELPVAVGDQVEVGAVLAVVSPNSPISPDTRTSPDTPITPDPASSPSTEGESA